MAPPRYPSNPNTIKLVLDFDTLDRLKARAKERRVDTTRCAYEGLQEWLGLRPPAASAPAAATPEDDLTLPMRRGLEAIDQFNRNKPKGNA